MGAQLVEQLTNIPTILLAQGENCLKATKEMGSKLGKEIGANQGNP